MCVLLTHTGTVCECIAQERNANTETHLAGIILVNGMIQQVFITDKAEE